MKIQAIQKLTLLDFPGRVACTVFTVGCNLRCPFCHNASLVRGGDGNFLTEDEVLSFLGKRKGVLDGVCITGGAPLINEDIGAFTEKIRAVGYAVKLDTNGTFPDRLEALISGGLIDYIAMDIKSSPDSYDTLCGVGVDIEKIKSSVALIKSSGIPHEFRTTAVKGLHTPEDFEKIGKWLDGEPYYLQAFVDSGDILGGENGFSAFSADEMKRLAASCGASVRGVG